ncbi:MAG: YabP/YqfC family sporulation protein [Thermaerobacter sp.]|nr:YabP/YqfC family sporulation protein [Thermaerobacter sp.]
MGTERIRAALARFFALPEDALLDVPRITMVGDLAVFIQNRQGIRRFTSELLEVATGRGTLVVHGEGMVLGAREIRLTGRIQGDGGLRAAHGPRCRAAVPGLLDRRGRRAAGTKDHIISWEGRPTRVGFFHAADLPAEAFGRPGASI